MSRRSLNKALATLLPGCVTLDVTHYRDETPRLDFAQFFNGGLDGWGMVQDRGGEVVKRFSMRMDCAWTGSNGTLDEHFEYSDGTTQERVWKVVKSGDRYVATAPDVVGTASGMEAGDAVRFRYVLAVIVSGRTWNLTMDDWMFLLDERTVLNRSAMSKFGFKVGELTVALRKR